MTPTSGNEGIYLIDSIENLRLCINVKIIKKIRNKTVQDICDGKNYWKFYNFILFYSSGFTKSVLKLAKSNKVIILNKFEIENIEIIVYERT